MRWRVITGGGQIVASVALAALLVSGACSRVVDGQPAAGPDVHHPTAPVDLWRDRVVPSDCLLSAEQMSNLAGVAVDGGHDTDIQNTDGTVGHNCSYYLAEGGILSFTAVIKIQAPSAGTVITRELLADIARPGATEVAGIGQRMIIEPVTSEESFCTMRVASDKYLANVVLVPSNIPMRPTIDTWKNAATAILAALPK
ncbi:hypothetical protein [Mycobacteroides abscessus]|uniref:hypothetical protein n=1 Tax=Mycobacteroides abscessus TaxID=36809 RepID=UPI0009424DEF|nr:hypothetical protein [Mycobacteroides abscessus]